MFALGLASLAFGVLSIWSSVKGVKATSVVSSVLIRNSPVSGASPNRSK